MRIACVLITHLRAKVELERHPHLRDRPAVIVDRSRGRPLVVDHFPAAPGVSAGMTLEQALSRHADTVALEGDEASYRRVFHQVLTSLQGISDRVEVPEPGTAYVSLDGLADLYGGEARLVSTLLNSVPQYLNPRVGVGDARFPTFVAARAGRPGCATAVPPDVAPFLAPHSIDLLPLPSDMKADMHRFGLHTMGDVASMGEEALTDQFWLPGKRAWSLSCGMDNRPLVPLKQEESVVEHISLPFSSTSMDLLQAAVDTLLRRAYSRPGMEGRYVGKVTLSCTIPGLPPWDRAFHLKGGAGSWERASRIIGDRLEADHPGGPVEEMSLTLADITGESGVQTGLFHDLREDRRGRLLEAERRLVPRMDGKHALYRVVEVAPWHPAPEMRAMQVPIAPRGGEGLKPLSMPVPVEVREGPGHQPVMVRLGKQWHGVAQVEDTWSFDLWWMADPISRTYYRVSLEDGRQAALFHDQRDSLWYRQGS